MKEQPARELLAQGQHLRFVKRGGWIVERNKISGIVGIVAITGDEQLVLVEQFRTPLQKNVIELPAGLAGDVAGSEHEPLENAAARELLEETGYAARKFIYLTEGCASAGVSDEIITLYLATGLTKNGAGGGDGSENITLHTVPLSQAHQWLESRRKAGTVIDLKVYAGLYFRKRHGARRRLRAQYASAASAS